MPQHSRVKSVLNANIETKTMNEISEIIKNAPRTDSNGRTISKSNIVELIIKKGLQHKQEIIQELQKL